MTTDTETLAKALDILAHDIQSDDGVANAAIREAAERLREQHKRIASLQDRLLDVAEKGIAKINEIEAALDSERKDWSMRIECLTNSGDQLASYLERPGQSHYAVADWNLAKTL